MKYWVLLSAIIFFVACNQQSTTEKNAPTDSAITNHQTAIERDAANKNRNKENNNSAADTTSPVNKLIVEGKSIGNIEIGMDDSKLEAFGKPDMSDAAMGKAWLTWYGKKRDEHNNKTQLNVYTAYKDTSMRAKTVQQIRTTSSFFKTRQDLHVYSSLNEIKQKYPALKKVASYTDEGRPIDVYDAQKHGIAFEIAPSGNQQICTGIIIHKPGVNVTQVYISLHADMKIL